MNFLIEIIKFLFLLGLLWFFQVNTAHPSKISSRDHIAQGIFQIGPFTNTTSTNETIHRKDKALIQDFDFTVKRNNDGKLEIHGTNKSTASQNQTKNLQHQKIQSAVRLDHAKPICKREENFFCTQVENYPSMKISKILDNMNLGSYFGDDIISNVSINQRFDEESREEPLCRSKEQLIHPEGLWGVDGKLEYIVNDHKYKQGVRIEQCIFSNKNDKRCQMTESFPNGYITECKQKYISRHLLTYNDDGKTIEKKLFKIPSCCQCVLRNVH